MMPAGKTIWKTVTTALIAVFCLSSCEREGLYDMARDGVPLVYALADNAGQGVLIVASEYDFYEEYPIPGLITPAPADQVCADDDGRVCVSHFSDIYFTTRRSPSEGWTYHSFTPINVIDIESTGNQMLLLMQDAANCLYRLDSETGLPVSMGNTVPTTPEFMSYARESGRLFVTVNGGGSTNVFYPGTTAALSYLWLMPVDASRVFFLAKDQNIYCGNNLTGIYRNTEGAPFGGGINFLSYALFEESRVYAARANPAFEIHRLNTSTDVFELVYSFPDLGGDIEIAAMGDTTLAIAIYKGPISPDNGLYLYSTENGIMKRLCSHKVVALHIR